jgi:hypothetical protein
MRVSSWKFMGRSEVDTDCPYGLMLGKQNRKRYFDGMTQATVEIEGRVHTFSLSRSNFWTTCPELRDTDLGGSETPIRDVLARLNALTWKRGRPLHFELELAGRGIFRLRLPPAPTQRSGGTAELGAATDGGVT